MAELSPAELSKKIRAGEIFRAYYIYGEDVASVETISKAILKKHLGKNWDTEVTKLSGENIDISALVDMLEICPMFSQWNGVFINDLNAEELSADELKSLIEAAGNLPEYTFLLINITGFDVKKGKKTMTARNKKLADCIAKSGVVCECGLKTMAVLVKNITDKARKNGCDISRNAAEMLAEFCGGNSLLIGSELDKLCAYRENEEIRPADVEEMVAVGIETDAFRLSRAISACNASGAMDIIHKLIQKKEEPVAIVAAISMAFTDLYRARAAMTAGKRASDVAADFSYGGRKFAVDNAFRDCRKISLESLRECVLLLRDADRSLKQTGAIPSLILERLVTEMLIAVRRK